MVFVGLKPKVDGFCWVYIVVFVGFYTRFSWFLLGFYSGFCRVLYAVFLVFVGFL